MMYVQKSIFTKKGSLPQKKLGRIKQVTRASSVVTPSSYGMIPFIRRGTMNIIPSF